MSETDFLRYKRQLRIAQSKGEVRNPIGLQHGKLASKKTCKELLEDYASKRVGLTNAQFRTVLDRLCRKKDGTISEHTQRTLAPLYAELNANRAPHYGIVLMVLGKLNTSFFPRRKKGDEETEEGVKAEPAKEAGLEQGKMVVKKSCFVETKPSEASKKAKLKQKQKDNWRKETAGAWRDDRVDDIKSVGNGL